MLILFTKSRVGPYTRNGKIVSAYDRSIPAGKGVNRRVPVRSSVFAWSGLPEKPIYADYTKLAEKHDNHFKDATSAMLAVEWVMEHPHVCLPATDKRFMMFIRRGSVDRCVVVETNVKHGAKGYSVRSSYILDKGQVKEYLGAVMKHAKFNMKMRKALGAGTLSPGFSRTSSSDVSDSGCTSRPLPVPRDTVQPSTDNILLFFGSPRKC